jgi:shikimate dehydrogenase
MGAGHVTVVDPAAGRRDALVGRYRAIFGQDRIAGSADIEASLAAADGLVHATPTGMDSHPGLPLPARLLRKELWVAEIVYFPLETELLRAARAAGCRTLDGSGMAINQAVEAFGLFSGLEANAERMSRHFLAQLPSGSPIRG